MPSVLLVALILHVAMGAAWTFATLAVAVTGWVRPTWLRLMLVLALVNMLAGIYLWHALHRGAWGASEHLLVVGTFCAFTALGLQAPVAFAIQQNERRLVGAPLAIYRVTAAILLAAATTMLASRGT